MLLNFKIIMTESFVRESRESEQRTLVFESIAGLAIQSLLDRGEHQASGGRR